MEIVKAQDCDLKQLNKIGMACFRQSIKTDEHSFLVELLFMRYFSKRKFKQRIKNKTQVYALKVDDIIIGFYELEKDGLLASLYIAPIYQHQGYGKVLMEHAFYKAQEMKLTKLILDANESAVRFYEKLGFKVSSKSKEILGVKMIPMIKRLSSSD